MLGQRQVIAFHPRHRTAVLDGSKTVTVRWNEAITVGRAHLALDPADVHDAVDGFVDDVQRVPIDELTPDAVHAPAGTDMDEYVRQLRDNYYPTMPADAILDVVHFHVEGFQRAGTQGRVR